MLWLLLIAILGACPSSGKKAAADSFECFVHNDVGGSSGVGCCVLCFEFSPSLGSRAYPCERIMTWTDLFKALTQWQYVAKKQQILCSRQFGLCPCVCFHIQIPERISNETGSLVEMLTSTASCRAKHIRTHVCLSFRITWNQHFP